MQQRRLLHRVGASAARRPAVVLVTWGVAAGAVAAAGWGWGSPPSEELHVPGAPSEAVVDVLRERFPAQAGGRAIAVFAATGRVDAPPARAAIEATMARIDQLDGVRSVVSPTGPAAPLLTSEDGRTAWAPVVFDASAFDVPEETLDGLLATAGPARAAGLRVGFGGQPLERLDTESTRTGEVIGIAVALVVLAVALGTMGAAALPLLMALVVVMIGYSATRLLATVTEINMAAQAIGSMIGLAVGVDYALFVVTRYRQSRREGASTADAVATANDSAGRSVLFAGGTVVISMLGLVAVGIPVVTSLAVAVSLTVAVAVAASLTLLPAALGALGPRIERGRLPFASSREDDDARDGRWSTRWATSVTRHPVAALATSAAVLLLLAAPFLSLRTGWPDARHRAEGDPARVAFDLMTDGFGVGANAPLVVAIDSGEAAAIDAARTWLMSLPKVVAVSPPLLNESGDLSLVQLTPATGPEDAATAQLVQRIRSKEGLLADVPEMGVTGATAFYVDLDARMASRLPWFVAFVIGLSVVLLTAVFRAPLVALKAAAMNLLGIAAAYGAVVMVFQWGWARGAVGIDQPVPIVSSLPVILFAVLFGLSMDYEVFILSRIRESWTRSGDNTAAVVQGLGASSRVVTAAAVIMVAVFAGFVTSSSIEIKTAGFGLAVAVLLDATLIRQVLLPSTMTLLGRRNWWLPAWLDRLLPVFDVEGAIRQRSEPAAAHVPRRVDVDRARA